MEKPPLQRNYGYSSKPPQQNNGYSTKLPQSLDLNDLNIYQEYHKKYSRSVNTRGNIQLTQNVYLIEGHGEDLLNDTFKVPEFSLVVVRVHNGRLAQEVNYIKDTDRLCKLGNTVLENPIKYAPKIINKVGTIAIYKPGDLCPNFRYTLLANFTPTGHETIVKPNSGILNFKMHCMNPIHFYPIHFYQRYKELTENCKTVKDIINVIKQFYKNSIYPTEDTIQKVIESMLPIMKFKLDTIIDDPAHLLNVFLENLRSMPNSPINVTQKELCENLPGVYYNFVCRGNEAHGKIYNNFNTVIGINNRNVKNTLKQRIGESEMHRKPYIYRAYKSPEIHNRLINNAHFLGKNTYRKGKNNKKRIRDNNAHFLGKNGRWYPKINKTYRKGENGKWNSNPNYIRGNNTSIENKWIAIQKYVAKYGTSIEDITYFLNKLVPFKDITIEHFADLFHILLENNQITVDNIEHIIYFSLDTISLDNIIIIINIMHDKGYITEEERDSIITMKNIEKNLNIEQILLTKDYEQRIANRLNSLLQNKKITIDQLSIIIYNFKLVKDNDKIAILCIMCENEYITVDEFVECIDLFFRAGLKIKDLVWYLNKFISFDDSKQIIESLYNKNILTYDEKVDIIKTKRNI